MEKNVGPGGRTARIVVGIALVALIYFGHLGETADIIAGIAAAYLLITAVLARCPLLRMTGVSTNVEESPYSTTDDRAGL